ncbi:MAG: FMN-binding protein [Mangrovibacterium sp.]
MNCKFTLLLCILFPVCIKGQPNHSEKQQKLETLHWIIERSPLDAIRREYDKTMLETGFPKTLVELKDGSYYGETPFDDFGYKHIISFEMRNGEIIRADYNEINENGQGKQKDADYCKRMRQSGTTPAIAYPKYEKQLMRKQLPDKVDAVSGATYSMYRFKLALAFAILNTQEN